jgi:hypothetical protein
MIYGELGRYPLKPHSSKIVFTLFNQEQFAFCVLHKWYIKRYTTEQIFDCFPVISLIQYVEDGITYHAKIENVIYVI